MNEVLSTVPAGAVTAVGHLVVFAIGWGAHMWWTRSPTAAELSEKVAKALSAEQIDALINDGQDGFSKLVAKAAAKLDKL